MAVQVIQIGIQTRHALALELRAEPAPGITTRAAPGKPVRYPLKKRDWLFVRGVSASNPAIIPAISDRGDYLSDHELITAQVTL